MARWPSFNRFGSSQLPENQPHFACNVHDGDPRLVGPHKPKLVSMGHNALAPVKVREPCGTHLEVLTTVPQETRSSWQTDALGLSGLTRYRTRHSGTASIYTVSALSKGSQNDVGDTTLSSIRSASNGASPAVRAVVLLTNKCRSSGSRTHAW